MLNCPRLKKVNTSKVGIIGVISQGWIKKPNNHRVELMESQNPKNKSKLKLGDSKKIDLTLKIGRIINQKTNKQILN